MRSDHEQERYLLRVLAQAAVQEGGWEADGRRHVVATVRAYTRFLTTHLDKEESILFPAVDDALSPEQLAELDAALDAFDRDRFGRENAQKLEALSAELAAAYPHIEQDGGASAEPPPSSER